MHERIFVALGGNQGDVVATMQVAVAQIDAWPDTALVWWSRLYRSKPVDAAGGDFINAVVELRSDCAPSQLLERLMALETKLGRARQDRWSVRDVRAGPRYDARAIDLDLLAYGDRVMCTSTLTLPHPRMHLRAFVLSPLCDLAPDWVLADGRDVATTLASMPDRYDVTAMEP